MTKQPGNNRDVYYISLLAEDGLGKPLNEYFTFDEASKLDLKDTGVTVLDVHDLVIRHKQRHPELDEDALYSIPVYTLVEDLIDEHPKASYFLDECPFVGSLRKWFESGRKLTELSMKWQKVP